MSVRAGADGGAVCVSGGEMSMESSSQLSVRAGCGLVMSSAADSGVEISAGPSGGSVAITSGGTGDVSMSSGDAGGGITLRIYCCQAKLYFRICRNS